MSHRRNPLAVLLVALLLGVVGIAAGCGDDDDSSDTKTETQAQTTETPTTESPTTETPDGEYPQVAIDNFTRSCESQSGATASRCKCAIDNLQEQLPYADFVRIDGAIRKGGTEAQQGLAEIQGIIQECQNE